MDIPSLKGRVSDAEWQLRCDLAACYRLVAAYGWSDLGPVPWRDEAARAEWTEALLQRLVDLNTRRAAEEATGTVRWLRPEFQDPARRAAVHTEHQSDIIGIETEAQALANAKEAASDDTGAAGPAISVQATQTWPPELHDQVRVVAQVLATSPAPLAIAAIENSFKGRGPWKKSLPRILQTLEALGRARRVDETRWAA